MQSLVVSCYSALTIPVPPDLLLCFGGYTYACCCCDPIDGSPPGSPVPEILQARTLEWVAISFSKRTHKMPG